MSPSLLPSFFKFKAQPLKEILKIFHSRTISSSEIVVPDDSCYGLENIINIINNYLYLLNDHSSFKNPRTHLLAPFYVKIALFLINAPLKRGR